MAELRSTVDVGFAGQGAGTGELTWGQRAIWREMRHNATMNISRVERLPEGTTVPAFAHVLSLLLSHYPAMRTRLGFRPDAEPVQVVAGSGVFTLDVVDVDDDTDPERVARQVAWHGRLSAFAYDKEWPLRVTVVRRGGVPTHAAVVLSHLSVGGGSLALMLAGLGLRGFFGRPAAPPASGPPAMTLLELAARERTPAVLRRSEVALAHWESQLRAMPLRAMPLRAPRAGVSDGGHLGARHWHLRSRSPATHLGMLAVAARTRTDTARVLTALFAVALARVTGVSPVVTRMVVNNRSRPGFAGIVGPVSQHGLFVLDVADITVDEAVARARTSALSAAKYAYYDPAELDALLVRLGRERHPHSDRLHVGTLFNDRRRQGNQPAGGPGTGPVVTPDQVTAAVEEFRLVWDAPLENFTDQLAVAVADRPGTIDLQVSVDTHYLPAEAVTAFLHEVQAVAVAAAFDPTVPTGVRRAIDSEGDQP